MYYLLMLIATAAIVIGVSNFVIGIVSSFFVKSARVDEHRYFHRALVMFASAVVASLFALLFIPSPQPSDLVVDGEQVSIATQQWQAVFALTFGTVMAIVTFVMMAIVGSIERRHLPVTGSLRSVDDRDLDALIQEWGNRQKALEMYKNGRAGR